MKYLIVGLGNIGQEYQGTRHNIGFRILDAFAEASNISFSTDRYGDVGTGRIKNQQVVLLKPSTYMNLSGNAVRYWKNKENIDIDHILVLVDDIALPFGAIRIKQGGSDAGHNGLKNIAAMLGTQAYPRLRFGIGNDFPKGCQIDYVLGHFTLDERQKLPLRVDVAVDAIRTFVLAGIQTAMCDFNNK
jgi:aminoacyl-tRNA hydrolase